MGHFRSRKAATSHVQIDAGWTAVRERADADVYSSPQASIQRGEKLMKIRKLGISILRAAIRHASPELQQWGTAMLNETDAIENDWAAFRWAVGGAVSLFRGFELPIRNASEVPKRLEYLQGKMRNKHIIGYIAAIVVFVGFSRFFLIFPSTLMRIGCIVTMAGSAFLAFQLRLNHIKRRAAACSSNGISPIQKYRAVLLHMRDFHSGSWLVSRMIVCIPGPLLFSYGFRLSQPSVSDGFMAGIIAFVALCILGVPLNLKLSRKFQLEVEQLEELSKTP